tara:strand:- start:140 stop:310 length:171 start_codon:yes stop_codon:yes gene_type:complete
MIIGDRKINTDNRIDKLSLKLKINLKMFVKMYINKKRQINSITIKDEKPSNLNKKE